VRAVKSTGLNDAGVNGLDVAKYDAVPETGSVNLDAKLPGLQLVCTDAPVCDGAIRSAFPPLTRHTAAGFVVNPPMVKLPPFPCQLRLFEVAHRDFRYEIEKACGNTSS
jgi:hypothetical protein